MSLLVEELKKINRDLGHNSSLTILRDIVSSCCSVVFAIISLFGYGLYPKVFLGFIKTVVFCRTLVVKCDKRIASFAFFVQFTLDDQIIYHDTKIQIQ